MRDGDSNGNLLGKFCGSDLPEPVVSVSNRLWIKYRTDFSVAGRGFHIFYGISKFILNVKCFFWKVVQCTLIVHTYAVLGCLKKKFDLTFKFWLFNLDFLIRKKIRCVSLLLPQISGIVGCKSLILISQENKVLRVHYYGYLVSISHVLLVMLC